MKKLFILIVLLFACQNVQANNINVSNVVLTGQNITEGYWMVRFDLSWENSWRTSNLYPQDGHNVGNWDAAWVFIKYRVGDGEWQHAKLHSNGHSIHSGTLATIEIGVPNERESFHITDNPGVGAFFYRSQNGTGTFNTIGNQLRWNYAVDGVSDDAELDLRVFAIEMVYVAPGAFWVGCVERRNGSFETGSVGGPFLVNNSWNGCIGNTNGCLWAHSTSVISTIGDPGMLQEHFPTGLHGFYSMKYEISQRQYVNFLNTLTPTQANARSFTGLQVRNAVRFINNQYETTSPFVANNFMNWMDGLAYLDWAGLRPMTELEFEKAARGPVYPVANEFAWGSATFTRATSITRIGQSTEVPWPSFANANFSDGGFPLSGPLRVGSFSFDSSFRWNSGAGYWGIMELSGNLWEQVVTVSNSTGRAFTGLHGDGQLTISGNGAVEFWPGGGSSGIVNATGSSRRGGSFLSNSGSSIISVRSSVAHTSREGAHGFRGVRSLPVATVNE